MSDVNRVAYLSAHTALDITPAAYQNWDSTDLAMLCVLVATTMDAAQREAASTSTDFWPVAGCEAAAEAINAGTLDRGEILKAAMFAGENEGK